MFRLLSSSDTVVRSCECLEAEIENEIVALNVENSTCYGLNASGSTIWRQIKTPTQIANLCAQLVTEYKVEGQVCERQVLDLLEELRAEGLIKIVEPVDFPGRP